jgi:nucleoside-diphosphate-sugar epimerase
MLTDPKKRFLITGGTGFLGSYLFVGLCDKGLPVTLLCRPKDGYTAQERVEKILQWFGKRFEDFPNLNVVEAYLDREMLGLGQEEYRDVFNDAAEIIHCASDTDFAERNRSVIESVNIGFLKNMLMFAKDSACVHFHYISTAYSSGLCEGECREELSYPAKFTNVYEETKNIAEKTAHSFCAENKVKLSIYRPSIVYGEAESGRSRKFNALYYPVKAVSYIKEIMLKDILERGGKRAAELGVSLKNNGTLVMPISLESISGGNLNLIPVDFFTRAMICLMGKNCEGGIYHIVNSSPGDLEELIQFTSKYFNIEGLKVVSLNDRESRPKNGLEQLFESYIKMYLPYIADKRVFTTKKTEPLLEKDNVVCPKMTYEIFKKCMDFAIGSHWGKEV